MKQFNFEQRYRKSWDQLENTLSEKKVTPDQHFPQHFRELCNHLALAKHRRYSPQLIDYLNELVTNGHQYFYQHNFRYKFQWLEFLVWGFPHTVRRNAIFISIAGALFLIPLLAMGAACYLNPELIYSAMNYSSVSMMEAMYDPANAKIGRERSSDTDIMMFGHYIQNNIGISFRTFAGGLLYGIGSIFFLVYNGLYIGAIAGHLSQLGYGVTFFSFVSGHGSFELTAIVFSGAAGLKLGYSLIKPGQLTVKYALRAAGKDAIIIMYGVIIMLIIAAFIEAFWSSTASMPANVKYAVGVGFWILLIVYFVFSGKRYESRPDLH